jgi:3-mercaptopyruvate sulfurtransferase SseA
MKTPIRILALVGLGIAVSGIAFFSQRQVRWDDLWHGASPALDEIRSIELPELLARMRQDKTSLLLVDARSRSDYEAGHLPGALHGNSIPWHSGILQNSSVRVVYGQGRQSGDARAWATLCRQTTGIAPRLYSGGWREWQQTGLDQKFP